MSELNIYQRINKVMTEVTYVQKDKQVSGGGSNYRAVTHDQVVSVARASLVKNGVVIYPEQLTSSLPIIRDVKQDIKMHLYEASYNIHFVNMDSPEDRITASVTAHAADNGDKAPGKCLTYATKAAILKVLCLESGDNEESRADERDRSTYINTDQAMSLVELCNEKGISVNDFCKKAQVDKVTDILVNRLDAAKGWLLKQEGKS